jgi:CRP/FNR family cyclic AMP-dependent transcriptional regulator
MADLDIAESLADSFFGSLPQPVLSDLRDVARIKELPAGKLVYDPQISIILKGALRAFVDDGSGRQITVSYRRRPAALGLAAAAGTDFPVAHQALIDTVIFQIPVARFDKIRRNNPELGWAATQEMALELENVLDEMTRVAFQPVRARIAHHILAISDCMESDSHAIHQSELAAAVGSVREVVSRTLGTLRDAGLVDVSHSGVIAVDKEGLRRVASQRE